MKKLTALFATLCILVTASAQTNWALDKTHTKIGFNVTHMVVAEVEGYFKDYDAKITSTTDDFNGAAVEFTAKTASVFTDNDRRDGHLKSDDFFNAEKFPELKFAGTLVKEGTKYVLKGNLTIRDVTKPVTFEVTYGGRIKTPNPQNANAEKAGFKIKGTIKRLEYGLKFNRALEGGGLVVSDDVELNIKVELNKG
jgi:polyisoprenoid-binding protein YceI